MSIVKFKRAKLLQDARFAKIGVEDIARAMATTAGPKALADYDAGLIGRLLRESRGTIRAGD